MWLLFLFALFGGSAAEASTIVSTKQGRVEGSLSDNGRYYEFLNIRYGVAERFRGPKPPPSFAGVHRAGSRVVCPQFPTGDPSTYPSDNEDCLVLNIYTPTGFANATLPVILFLHGGGFGTGSGSSMIYGPQYLVSHGLVVVTVSYRLNVYGFLNLGIREAPGNAGLKDIRAALRWVQENVAGFGGDADSVTVYGQGSGGTAALYLMLSNSTRGLFSKVISQSGTLLSPLSFDADGLKTASQVAKSLEVISEDPHELYKLYNNTALLRVEDAIMKQMNPSTVFLPTVERIFEDEEAFLTDTPYNILLRGEDFNPVPTMMGVNTVEGLICTVDYNTITSLIDRVMNEDYTALDQRNFHADDESKEDIRQTLKETYFNTSNTEENVVGGLINLNTDFCYVGPMAVFKAMFANRTDEPMFAYIFDHIGNRNLGRILTNCSLPATTNMDDLFYLWELERLPLPMDENDARMVTFMTMMWSNFAKYGNPTPEPDNGSWLPYPHHLAIKMTPEYVGPLTPERAYFWQTLFEQYGVECLGRESEM